MSVLKYIKLFYQSVQTIMTIWVYFNRQKIYIKKNIVPFLNKAMVVNDGSIDNDDIKKITGYYGLAVPAILGETFCVLRHKKMTSTERIVSTYQGAITGLGDDFFDKQRLSETDLKNFIENPDLSIGKTELEKIALHFYSFTLNNNARPLHMKEQLLNVFKAQVLSKKQIKTDLSIHEIKDITFQKGGQSLLFYRTAFDHPLKKGEDDVLYGLGGLMQLSNDIFDVYKDLQNGIHTLVTTTSNIKVVRQIYDEKLKASIQATLQLAYNKKDIRKFLQILSLGFSRCYVCLDQLESNEKKSDNIFRPHMYTRKDLVCDMDTTANKLKSIKYHIRICAGFISI